MGRGSRRRRGSRRGSRSSRSSREMMGRDQDGHGSSRNSRNSRRSHRRGRHKGSTWGERNRRHERMGLSWRIRVDRKGRDEGRRLQYSSIRHMERGRWLDEMQSMSSTA